MRSIIVVCVLASVALASASTELYPRGCRYIMGRCVEACPVGTHAYGVGCGYRTPEATCTNPHPEQEKHKLCDYSACHCDAPTVRDENINKCVQLADCSPPGEPHLAIDPPKPEEPKPVQNSATAEASAPATA